MSTPTVNSGHPSTRRVVRSNSYSSCFPCDRESEEAVAVSTLATMKLGAPRDEGRACGAAVLAEGSAPPRQQPDLANVGQLVAKAKKAATSLWMILHAQSCLLTNGNCTHRGCSETKLILEHVKSCPAGPGFPCPTQCKGCNETRKLLAHYRRCKDMRVKQVGLGRRSGLQPDSSCLVCSLMARYAKNMMDRTKSSSSQGKNNVSSFLSSSLEGKFNVEKGMTNFSLQAPPSPADGPKRTLSGHLMPPPPPRSGSAPMLTDIPGSSSNESFFGSPPNPSQPMHFPTESNLCSPSLLGKSFDSNVRVPFPILKHPSREVRTKDDEELIVPGPLTTSPNRRQRAESYDERKNRVKFAPTLISSRQYYFDEQGEEDSSEQIMNKARPRSASCGSMSSKDSDESPTLGHGCETIAEEGAEYEEPVFEMD